MALVTISATYGAGGGTIAPEVADRLAVPFLDRAIATEVGNRLDLSEEEVRTRAEGAGAGRGIGRLLAAMGSMGGMMLGAASPDPGLEGEEADGEAVQSEIERVVRELAATGAGVILGRAAALILAGQPGALHVRLDGSPEARTDAAARLAGIDREEAERRRRSNDEVRHAYVRHFHGADPRDPAHYHLIIDTTALPWGTCADLVADAARSL